MAQWQDEIKNEAARSGDRGNTGEGRANFAPVFPSSWEDYADEARTTPASVKINGGMLSPSKNAGVNA